MRPLYQILLFLLIIPLYFVNIIIALLYALTVTIHFFYFRNPKNTLEYWTQQAGLTQVEQNVYQGTCDGVKVKLCFPQDSLYAQWNDGFGDFNFFGQALDNYRLLMLPRKLSYEAIITNRHWPVTFNDQVSCPAFEGSSLVLRVNDIPHRAAQLMVNFPFRQSAPLLRSPVFVVTKEGLIFGQFRFSQKHHLKEMIQELDKIAQALS